MNDNRWYYFAGSVILSTVSLLLVLAWVLFWRVPNPVVQRSPVPVTVQNNTIIYHAVYTRYVDVPVTFYSFFVDGDGVITELEPARSRGGEIGEGLTATIPVPIPGSLPDGTYVRKTRAEYYLYGSTYGYRISEWETEPFTLSRGIP